LTISEQTMTLSLSKRARRKDAPTPRQASLSPANRRLAKWLVLGLLAACSFGTTYAVVNWSSRSTNGPGRMVWIPGGEFTMGTNDSVGWADEKPAHRVRVNGFWMDETDVTNAQFRAFVEATGHVTTAEKPVDAEEILRQLPPGTAPPPKKNLVPGSLVFVPPDRPVKLTGPGVHRQWWKWVPGANWRRCATTSGRLCSWSRRRTACGSGSSR
jgi:formylglycine-generating enzyme required for sulfatase activity